jgi:hypothetical protein
MEATAFNSNGEMGKLSLIPIKPMQYITKLFWCVIALGTATSLLALPSNVKSTPTDVLTVTVVKATEREAKLDAYLSVLAWKYECVGECAVAAQTGKPYKRIDSNHLYSYGCLQFQEATYFAVTKKYKIDPWANGGIYNCDNQLALASKMFLEDPVAASQHWYTSIYTRGLGVPNI